MVGSSLVASVEAVDKTYFDRRQDPNPGFCSAVRLAFHLASGASICSEESSSHRGTSLWHADRCMTGRAWLEVGGRSRSCLNQVICTPFPRLNNWAVTLSLSRLGGSASNASGGKPRSGRGETTCRAALIAQAASVGPRRVQSRKAKENG